MRHTAIVAELRKLGISQDRIAKAAGCSQATISNIEGGRHPNPTIRLIEKLEKARRELATDACKSEAA